MKFGPVPIADAAGCIAAHSVRAGAMIVKKGAAITQDDVARLTEAGLVEIIAVRLETGISARTRPRRASPAPWRDAA